MASEAAQPSRNLVLCFDDNVTTWHDSLFTNLHKMVTVIQNDDARYPREQLREQIVWHHKGPLAVDVGKSTRQLPTDSPDIVELKSKANCNTVPEPGIQWLAFYSTSILTNTGIQRTQSLRATHGFRRTMSESGHSPFIRG